MLAALERALAGSAPIELTAEGTVVSRTDVLKQYPQAAVVVRTSGSTGTPKETVLSAAALRASAEATEEYLGFSGQWLLCLPVNYVAGLAVLTRSIFAGHSPVSMPTGTFTPEQFVSTSQQMDAERRIISVVPTQLQRILTDPGATDEARYFDSILVGGAATNPTLSQQAQLAGLNIVRTYGMAETCGGCVYDGIPLPVVDLSFSGDRVLISGPMLAEGYFNQPHLNAERFKTIDGGRHYVTDDLGQFVDGSLRITGRVDDVLITGGVKVSAAAVQNELAQHTTAEVCVVGIPDPEWGTRICAAVEDPNADLRQLTKAVVEKLPAAAVPKSWWRTDAFPRLSTGKVDRGAVQQYFAAQSEG